VWAANLLSTECQQYFGTSPDPDTWLAAHAANFRVIHAVVQLSSQTDGTRLMWRSKDFSEDQISESRSASAGKP